MKESEVKKKYQKELWAGLGIYTVMLVLAIRFGRPLPEGALRTAVLVSPMLGFLFALWAVVRHFGRMDEYVRLVQLENIGIAAATTAGLTFTYGFLESAGFPKASMFWVWPIMGAAWFAASMFRCRQAR